MNRKIDLFMILKGRVAMGKEFEISTKQMNIKVLKCD